MAQGHPPLDLSLPKVSEGVVVSIREAHVHGEIPAPRATPPAGTPSDIEHAPPVGAVVYLPFGGTGDKTWRFGAAGTPEMQARLAQTAYEVIVDMEDGERRTFAVRDPGAFRPGERVVVRAGELQPRASP